MMPPLKNGNFPPAPLLQEDTKKNQRKSRISGEGGLRLDNPTSTPQRRIVVVVVVVVAVVEVVMRVW